MLKILAWALTPELSRPAARTAESRRSCRYGTSAEAAKRVRLERIVRPQQPANCPTVALPKDYQRNGLKVTVLPQRLNGPYPEPLARDARCREKPDAGNSGYSPEQNTPLQMFFLMRPNA